MIATAPAKKPVLASVTIIFVKNFAVATPLAAGTASKGASADVGLPLGNDARRGSVLAWLLVVNATLICVECVRQHCTTRTDLAINATISGLDCARNGVF